MTGGGRIWRRCFKIAIETVKYSPKCRGIRRNSVAIIDVRLFIGHCIRTMFTTFTKVANCLMSAQFLAPLALAVDSGG
jgi:hypothetical protein